jgi:integrase
LDITFVKREVKYQKRLGNNFQINRRIIIAVRNNETGIEYGHPITEFIHRKYHATSLSLNNEKGVADVIVQFLNYILNKVNENNPSYKELKDEGLYALRNQHAEQYLEYCGEDLGNNRTTVKRKEIYLTHFYNFLWKEGILKSNPQIYPAKKMIKRNENMVPINNLQSPFVYTKPSQKYQNFKKRKDFLTQSQELTPGRKIKRLNLSREFIYIACKMFPDIALAVAFQFYGGLRAGEVMNLTENACISQGSSKYAENGLILQIRDRQRILFPDLKDTSMNQVKNERDQAILVDPILSYTYKMHMKNLDTKKKNPHKPLFLNYRMKPMSTSTYYNRFTKLKNFYLGMLSNTEGRYQDFLDFSDSEWSTHIGRGTFTNMCIDAGFSPIQTAILRGDKSPDSMFQYTDLVMATYNISQAVGLLSDTTIDFGDTDNEFIKSWKDVVHFGKTR